MSKQQTFRSAAVLPATDPVARPPRRRWPVILLALAVVAGIGIGFHYFFNNRPPAGAPAATAGSVADYVGAAVCSKCHAREFAAWQGSHHDRAMQHASAQSVLGNFDNARFDYGGITSTFFRRDGRYYVRTDGADGKLHDFEVRYTFGVTPLQQYLVEFPDGRVQALTIAWDARPQADGGQRWFHLYPGQPVKAGDRLHWTGIEMNWNYQCAECHSTNLRKNYDAASDRFRTTWSEINVACEACHGPGSRHVAWADKRGDWLQEPAKGLAVALDERRGVTWAPKDGADTATRSTPRASRREIETCARCHARRGALTDDYVYGRPLGDSHRPALLEEGLYWPDGQMRDEVYNYASFLQSAMFAKGVTCSDCHEPHSLKLRKAGNAVCTQCHLPNKFDLEAHTHHKAGTPGAQCPACHMPTTTYMGVDARHDHSMRVPRPDRSIAMGVPNACAQCHRNRTAQWADAAIRSWEREPAAGHQSFAEALYAGGRMAADGRARLLRLIEDAQQPAVARASAIALLGRYPGPYVTDALRRTLDDPEPMVRAAAVDALAGADPAIKAAALARMAADPVRVVRLAAAAALAGVPPAQIDAGLREAVVKAGEEYLAAQQFNADRPDGQVNLGLYYAGRGDFAQAERAFRRALEIAPWFVPAALNLADLRRAQGDERAAETTLRAALQRNPRDASLRHALGLALVRQKRADAALAEFAQAAKLAPDDPTFAYVQGIALHSAGRQAEAIRLLGDAHRRFGGDAAILLALATMERDRGGREAAAGYARKLVELTPDDPQAQALLRELSR